LLLCVETPRPSTTFKPGGARPELLDPIRNAVKMVVEKLNIHMALSTYGSTSSYADSGEPRQF